MRYKIIGTNDFLVNPVMTVLNNRGVIDTEQFLNLDNSVVNDYKLLKNIDAGVKCLAKHLNNNSNIFIQVDSDCDGYTSASAIYNYIHRVNPKCNITYRVHDGKEHGIVLNTVPSDTNLVIIPDAGSNQYNDHLALARQGIDVIVLDHHIADKESEYAIIINNQLSPNYPNKNFSGVGIVYKFLQAMDEELGYEGLADEYLDLVSIGNIADVMDTRELETRYYILEGLKRIKNPFIQALIDKQNYSIGGIVNITNMAFYIVPLINACVRFGTQEDKENMFKAFIDVNKEFTVMYKKRGASEATPVPLVDDMARECGNIKNRQNTARDKGVAQIEERIESKGLLNNKILIVNCTEILSQTLTGLVATQLANRYKRPVILLRYRKEKENVYGGSARGYEKSDIKDFRHFLLNTGMFEMCEGHENAFGIEIKSGNLVSVNDLMNVQLKDWTFDDVYEVDFIIPAKQINTLIINDLNGLKHIWGQGVTEPYLAITGLTINQDAIALMGKTANTLKFNYRGIDFIKFNCSQEECVNITSYPSVTLDIVGRCSVNEYMGKQTPQIIMDDYNIVSTDDFAF